MSNKHSQHFEKINDLVGKHGEKGLRLLFIFKTVKNSVTQWIEDKIPDIEWRSFENEINKDCMKTAKLIMDRCGLNPDENDIKKNWLFSVFR